MLDRSNQHPNMLRQTFSFILIHVQKYVSALSYISLKPTENILTRHLANSSYLIVLFENNRKLLPTKLVIVFEYTFELLDF